MRRSHWWLLFSIVCLVAMPPLAFAGDCIPGDCQYLPDNGTKAACIGALVIGYVIYERSKEKNKTSADFEKQIREKMREFEQLQRDLKDQLDYSMQDLEDFNDKYNDNLQCALKALDAYGSTYQQKLVPDLQNIWDTMSDHQLGRKIADWTDTVLAAAQIAESGYQLGRAALQEAPAVKSIGSIAADEANAAKSAEGALRQGGRVAEGEAAGAKNASKSMSDLFEPAPGPGKTIIVGGSNDADLIVSSTKVKPIDGVTDVHIHGTDTSVDYRLPGKNQWGTMDEFQLLDRMKADGYNGGPIRLLACDTGNLENANNFAQRLADAAGVPVSAPTDTLWIHRDGSMSIGYFSDVNTGQWKMFMPGGGRP
jgi:hypothetical protein